MYGSLIPVLMLMMMLIKSRVLGLVVRSYAIRSVCLSFCLSLCIITAKVIRQFHWNVVLWLGLYQLQELINFRGVPFADKNCAQRNTWTAAMRKATDIGSIRNLLMRCVDVREEELITNYSTVVLFKVMQGHRSSCCMPSRVDGCDFWVTR